MPPSFTNTTVSPPAAALADPPGGTRARKRRINFACNYCRNRKTRCDEQKPSCRACIAAGIECVTTDRRRPGIEVQRRETKRRWSRASSSSLTHSATTNRSPHSPPSRDAESHGPAGAKAKRSPSTDGLGSGVRSLADSATGPMGPISVIREDREDEEPSACRPKGKYQGKLPVVRPSRGSNSVEILGDWLDLAARRLNIQQRRGLPPAAAYPASHPIHAVLSAEPCPFPPRQTAHLLAPRYLDGVNLVYPLVNRDRFMEDLDLALELGPVAFAEARGIAALATVYLILAVGFASESLSGVTVDARRYIAYCKTLLGHLVIDNNVETVRAVVLLALCLHCYDDCAGAWNTLGVGVSMATSLRLHRPRTCRNRSKKQDFVDDEERRVFWLGIYSFEKILAFEMGHMSSINDEECYPPRVEMPAGDGTSSRDKAFAVTVDLARILSDIGRKAVIVSRKEDGIRVGNLKSIIAEKVQTTGESQLLLTRWGESVPDELRPISDILIGSRICPFASFISTHYNNAIVILSRNSLLISEEAISSGANIIAKGKPWDYIMRNGQSLAANAARKILRIVVEAVDSRSNTVVPNLLAPLHALCTLAIHVVTHAESRISTMDLQLIKTSSDSMKEIYMRLRGDGLLDLLFQKLDALVQRGMQPPEHTNGQHVNDISPLTTKPEPSQWQQSGEVLHQNGVAANWADNGGNRPGQTNYHHPVVPFFNNEHDIPLGDDFGVDTFSSAMSLTGDDWSPGMSDGIGWDWACFSHLLPEQFQPQ